MKKRFIGIMLSLSLVTSAFAACDSAAPTPGGATVSGGDGPVRIAVAAPMTGDNAEYGQGFRNAVQMQAAIWNEAGGILGRQVEVVVFDDVNSSEEAAAIAQRIVAEGDIVGVIGHFTSGVAMTAAPTYNENKVINISPSASHPDFSGIGEFIFRNNTVIHVEAAAGLDIAVTDLGVSNIGIVSIMTEWGDSTSAIVTELIGGIPNANLVGHERVMEDALDLNAAITTLEAAGAEAIICVSMHPTLSLLATQYQPVNPNIHIIGFSNAYTQGLIELAGVAANGIRFPVSFFADSPDQVVRDFVEGYIAEFGYSPSALTAQAFDSAGWLLTAIQAAGTTDGQTVRDTLINTPYTGAAGSVEFSENGDVVRDFFRVLVQGEEFIQTYP